MTERLLLLSGLAAVARRRRRGQVLVLAYHNVVPDDAAPCGDAALHLPRARFAAHLDALARTHDVVALSEALAARTRSASRPLAVVTFDDAYRGALTLGTAELAKRGMTATVFVAPAFVGGGAFWWDRIVASGDGARVAFRRRALEECAGRDEAVRALAARSGLTERDVPAYARCASETELAEAVRRGTVTVASHSWSHPNLAALSGTELREELVRPLAWLRERFAGALPVLAYPYGRLSDDTAAAARDAGYSIGFANAGGWMRPGFGEMLRAPRVDVPSGVSDAGFALRAAGLLAA